MKIDLVFHKGSAWFSGEDAIKGELSVGQLADFAVLDNDYFAAHNPGLPPVSPDWSPVKAYGGCHNSHKDPGAGAGRARNHDHAPGHSHWVMGADGRVWQTGCNCGV